MRFGKWHGKCLKNTVSEDMPELDIPDDSERIVQTKFIQSMHRSLQTLLSVSMEQSIPTLFLKGLKKKKTPDA